MQLTVIQYDAIMKAIEIARDAIQQDTFIDPYGENPDGYTNENMLAALDQVEQMLISENIPF